MGREGKRVRALTPAERAAIARWWPEATLKNRTVAVSPRTTQSRDGAAAKPTAMNVLVPNRLLFLRIPTAGPVR